jgi:endonuclease YncB( thermonuclease family)
MFVRLALTRHAVLVSAFLFATISAPAATLYGRVESVDEGDVLTVFNLNRSIKIRLLGIDAPEKEQPLAELSRRHLADLVLNKFVVVHYTGLGQNGYIVGKVTLDDMDVCAQMLRDGVAWYDMHARLSQQEQQMYAATEQAARDEHRGIWESVSPVAPWDFLRKAKEPLATRPVEPPERTGPSKPEATPTPTTNVAGDIPREFTKSILESNVSWKLITPAGFNFSVLVPGNSKDEGVVIPLRDGKLDLNVSEGTAGGTAYFVLWAKGPNGVMSDDEFVRSGADQIAQFIYQRLTRMERRASLDVTYERDVKIQAMKGKQYKVSLPGMNAVMQVFSRHNQRERELYILCALNTKPGDDMVGDFMKSLTLGK